VQLVLSLGRHDAKLDVPSTSNAIIVPYAPQLELLQRAVAVVTHGGLNTVLETLSQGLPMVAIPLTNDQPGVARRLESLGVAELVPPGAASDKRLCQAIKHVLQEPQYRESAEHCLKQLRCAPNVADAAALVGHALTNRVQLTRADATAVRSRRPQGPISGL
jgi:UDP:flavonoid glycosyltransferase YjiC (YdhE family)